MIRETWLGWVNFSKRMSSLCVPTSLYKSADTLIAKLPIRVHFWLYNGLDGLFFTLFNGGTGGAVWVYLGTFTGFFGIVWTTSLM